jgi:hypothetical protein
MANVSPTNALNIADRALDLMLKATEGLGLMHPVSRIAMLSGRAERLRGRAAEALVRGHLRRADRLLHRAAAVQARADKLEVLL